MSMNDEEWGTIARALANLPSRDEWTEKIAETYRAMLAGVSFEEAMVGLARFANSSEKWRPSWAEFMRLATGQSPTAATFLPPEAAWLLIEKAVRRIPGGVGDASFPERHQAAIDWLREQDEAVAAWAAARGLRGQGSLGALEVHDPEYGGARLKHARDEYGMLKMRAEERAALGQAPFTERAFLVRGTGDRRGLKELVDDLRPDQRQIGPGGDHGDGGA